MRLNILRVLTCACSVMASAGALRSETISLSDLDLTKWASGWGTAQRNLTIWGTPLTIGGQKFARGVGTHANSRMRLALYGKAKRFLTKVGVDDSAGGKGSVEFIITADTKVLWRSGLITGGTPAIPVTLKLDGVRELILEVTDHGDGSGYDHADWADAAIEMIDSAAKPVALPTYDTVVIKTDHFSVQFRVGDDRRLYQQSIGLENADDTLTRTEEAYPPSGNGYIWEPALQVIHADGNTSTDLLFNRVTQTNEAGHSELTKIQLHDPAYPLEVVLCFRTYPAFDLIEQWTEIRHRESNPIQLIRMASSSLVFNPTNLNLMHFFGDWAAEMNPVTEPLTPGIKILDSKIGVRAHQYSNPSFILSLDGRPAENAGRILAGSLAWSGSFQCAFDYNGGQVRALTGLNPFASIYNLAKGEIFTTPAMIWVCS